MNELTLDGKTYVSSKRAAEITGYAKDYVGQLCREGHVEARLVGRNWYVLESSIRAHRFGKEASTEEAPKEVPQSWSNPKYIPEDSSPLPVFAPVESDNAEAVMDTAEEVTKRDGAILTDMEAAWKEWFTRRPQEMVAEAAPVAQEDAGEVPVALNQIADEEPMEAPEEPEQAIEVVDLRPTDSGVLDLAHPVAEIDEQPAIVEVEEVRRVKVATPRRRSPIVGNKVLQSVFIALALISASIAAIGTGYAQKIVGTNLYRLSEINFIAGVSEINR